MIFLLQHLLPSVTCRIHTQEKILFLTFDDGPVPEVTPEVLDMLKIFRARATFFCIGDNISKHPQIFRRIIAEGHTTSNHTYHHLNGWKTGREAYVKDTADCSKVMEDNSTGSAQNHFFRPPYGKMTPGQYRSLTPRSKIIMWDVLSRDWKQGRSGDACFETVKGISKPGSIVVFHDSIKARERMLPALQKTLRYYQSAGYRFEALNGHV